MVSDCDKWIAKINAEAGIRVDEAGWKARQDAGLQVTEIIDERVDRVQIVLAQRKRTR